MKRLGLSAVITTSAIAVSDAFSPLPPKTPLHLPATDLHATCLAPLESTIGSSSKADSRFSNKAGDLRFFSSDSKTRSSRYGGRAISGDVLATEGDEVDSSDRAFLGFDLGLNDASASVSSSSSLPETELSKGCSSSIVDVNHSSTSPIKKQIACKLQAQQAVRRDSQFAFIKKEAAFTETDRDETGKVEKSGNGASNRNSVPAWFPYTPTRRQIESLKVVELRDACKERGLPKGGNKKQLQERLIQWTNNHHRRRVLERNALHVKSGEGPIQDAINNALYSSSKPTTMKEVERYSKSEGKGEMANGADCVEPLINRRKALLRSKKFSFSKSKGTLGFEAGIETDDDDHDAAIAHDDLMPTKAYLSDLRKAFDKNVDRVPNNFQVKQLYQRAKHADQAGDTKRAKAYLQELREVTPGDSRVIRRLARLEMQEGHVHKAREILQVGLREMPKNGDILQGLGQLELKTGNKNEARGYFKEAITASPVFPNPYHALATLEHSEGNIRVATTILRMGLKHCPSNHRLHHALGDLYREAKMLDMAEKAYQKGLKCIDAEAELTGKVLYWGKSFFYTALSYVYYDRGDIDGSRDWLRKSIGKESNQMHSQGWLALAQLEESEQRIDHARNVYHEAISIYEKRRGISKFRASSRSMVGRKRFIRPAKLGDKWINVYNAWIQLEEKQIDYNKANNAYSRAAAAFPKDWNILSRWAQFQVKNARFDRARTLFELACDGAGSKDAKPYRLYAEFEMSSGNHERARSILFLGAQSIAECSDGARQSDEFARLYHSWALCEWHLGNLDRAEKLFDHSLRLIESGADGAENRSLVLYSIARFLFHARSDLTLSQHCIGLSISENLTPANDAGIWLLWANVAKEMENDSLRKQCLAQFNTLNENHINRASFPAEMSGFGMNKMLRRAPWQFKLSEPASKDSWYNGISFPEVIPKSPRPIQNP